MFVADNQIYYFAACFLAGMICGLFYLFSVPLRVAFKSELVAFLCDLGHFLVLLALYCAAVYRWRLPNFRIYMPLAALAGMAISTVIVQNTLAKSVVLLYNLIERKIKEIRKEKYEQRKSKKADERGGSGGNGDNRVFAGGNDISNGKTVSIEKGTARVAGNQKTVRTAEKRHGRRTGLVAGRVEDRGGREKIRVQKER